MRTAKTTIFVEATALTATQLSGVGHTLLFILKEWARRPALADSHQIVLVVPRDQQARLAELDLPFSIRPLPISSKLLRLLRKFNMLPRFDRKLGRGLYLFPNYWNWPLVHSPSLTYVYDLTFVKHPEFVHPANRRFLAAHLASWLQRTTQVLTVSQHAKRELTSTYRIAPKKVSVIYNGVNQTKVSGSDIARVKQAYQLPDNFLLYVGNIEPRKNLSRLIAAYKLLPNTLQRNHALVIVGGGGWNNQTILNDIAAAQQAGLPVIKVQQYVPDDDLPALYQAAAALVHPALYEGFGMTPLEAMAQGTPVIVANNSSLPEVVGDAGLYVNATDTHDISAKIKLLLEDTALQHKLQKAGPAHAEQFSWANTVAELARCIQNLGETHE